MNDKADKLLRVHAKNVADVAELSASAVVGEHVLRVLRAGKPLTLDALRESLQAAIDTSKSARGEVKPQYDSTRAQAEVALEKLQAAVVGI